MTLRRPAFLPVSSPTRFPRLRRLVRGCAAALVCAGFFPAALPAQDTDPLAHPESGALLLRTFKPRDYQGSPVIARVLEHPGTGELLLLAGTTLHVFDGTQWTAVPTETPAIRCLAVDAAGRAWLGGVDQIGYADRDATGRWQFNPLADRLPEPHRKLGRVWDCAVTADSVWFGTETKAVRWHNNAFTVFEFPSLGTLLSAGGHVFFQIKNKSLHRWDGAAFREFSTDPLVSGPSLMRLYATADGALDGMNSAGAFFRIRGERIESIAPHAKASLGTARIICALPRLGGGWYVGTDSAGLLILDREGRLVRKLTRADGFTDSPISDLTHDRTGALWAATFSGPFQIEQPDAVSFFSPTHGLPESISLGLERHQGRLYVGTPAGLMRLVPGRGQFELTPGSPRYPQKLLPRPDGLLIAHGAGISRLHDEKFTSLAESNNPVTALATSRRDLRALLAGRSAGFTVFQRQADGPLRELRHFPDLGQVRDVVDDADGQVWIATSTRGIHRLVPGAGDDPWATATLTTFDTKSRTLAGTSDSTFALTTPFGLSFNTGSGHVRFDSATGRFVADDRFFLGERPIAAFGVTAALGKEGWATANFGGENSPPIFGRIEPTGPARANLFPVPPAVQDALGPIDGGRILIEGEGPSRLVWSRTVEGLARIRPAALAPAPADWKIQLTGFEAHGTAQPLAAAHPQFAYSRHPYVFTFQAPRLERGAQVTYETRLTGWEPQWSPATAAREARYTGLPFGQYRFEVRARDRLGRLSAPVAYAFGITPPVWLTPWAFAAYTLALVAAVYGLIRWRVRLIERDRRRLEALVATRTAELATARDAAEAASRAKSAFLAAMSHELRTPLNGVIGYAQVLQDDRRLLSDQRERLRIVQNSGEHLLRMINDVLDLAKIEAGKLELRPAPFALADLVRDIVAAHAPTAAAKRLTFTTDLAPDLPPWVEGDAQKLRQILDNLLGNAVKFTAHGSVSLRVSRSATTSTSPLQLQLPGEGIAFAVQDTGPGIDATDQARLFQPFEQATRSRPNAPGAGLGLAISRALVDRLGGSLFLSSEPGRGSTFTFSVPLPPVAPDPVLAARSRRLTGYDGPRRHVLIVDDHAINRSLLTDLLVPLGFTCSEFPSGEAALTHLARSDSPLPDLAILDVRMQGLDGLELTRRLRALPRGASLKILLTSASVLTFDPAEGRAAGCDDFLPKPFRTADLVEKITALLALTWQEDPASPFAATPGTDSASATTAPTPVVPLPSALRDQLRELLAQGDLDAFRAALTAARPLHPACEPRFAALEAAAAAFELSRLRHLLDGPP